MVFKLFPLFLAHATLITAQSSIVSSSVSIAPAAETVTSKITRANTPLFQSETIQLSDSVISHLQANPFIAEYASLFDFEDSSKSRARRIRNSSRCKTMPGDLLYPQKAVWDIFNLLLGGDALEKIIPIGSPCYKVSEYNNYDAERCASLIQKSDQEEI